MNGFEKTQERGDLKNKELEQIYWDQGMTRNMDREKQNIMESQITKGAGEESKGAML